MSDVQIASIAEQVPKDKGIPVGLRLGHSYSELITTKERCGNDSERARFEAIKKWQRDAPHGVDEHKTIARVFENSQLRRLANDIRKLASLYNLSAYSKTSHVAQLFSKIMQQK